MYITMTEAAMSFFKDIIDGLSKRIGYIEDPYKVKDTSADQYTFYDIVGRHDSLVLYSRPIEAQKHIYELVVHKDVRQSLSTLFSLIRSEDKCEAMGIFHLMKEILPSFMACSPDLITRDNLQELSNVARKQPTWTPAHIASYLGWTDCFKNDKISRQVNDVCSESFVTPLHLAVKCQKLSVIQTLVGLDVRLDLADKNGDTVYHCAATTSKEIIQALVCRGPPPIINERNKEGHTPLHLACLANNPDCVKELLRSGADVNVTGIHDDLPLQCAVESSSAQCAKEIIDMYPNQLFTQDMQNGGTPLHWVKTPQCLEALIDFGCLLDAKNFQGETALHVMVSRNRMPCVITLLAHGASPDISGSNGNRPLHLAVKSGDPVLVQTLVVFDADTNLTNSEGETPRHLAATSNIQNKESILYILHAVGAKRCHDGRAGCSHGCAAHGDFNGVVPEKMSLLGIPKLYDDLMGSAAVALALARQRAGGDAAQRTSNILCLDGGGIKGLVLIQLLSILETTVGSPIIKHFDWVAGTSTGGILALALTLGKSVRDCRCLYFRLKDKVFVGYRPYDPEPLEAFLQKEFGENTVMDDIKGPKVMVTAVLADRHPADLHLFRNYASPTTILGKTENGPFTPTYDPKSQLVWRAGRASGAAPTYFRALGRFLDGGLISNNPTLDAITEFHERNLALKFVGKEDQVEELGVVVSLGTGKIPVTPITTIDVFKPDSIWSAAKIAMGVSALGQLLVDKVTEADGSVVDRAQAWSSMIQVPYFRINPPLTENVNLDEVDNKILVRTLWEASAYLNNRRTELAELATLLKR